ncbi:hypothetical protein DRN69_06615 [Candidatus Pacearchaeota archaeon]|nr:MAG: hypothetical protein DRN69_06615 [Candidatus Pacearchaeota archaeon]
MSELIFTNYIKDIIWGEIPITELEYKIIHSSEFSRLRGIQQMGLMHVVFPDATHSRFQHSIGVMHVADQMLSFIKVIDIEKNKIYKLLPQVEAIPNLRQIFRLAALFHDFGHPPFSHVVEECFRKYPELKECGEIENHLKDFLRRTFLTPKLYTHEEATLYLLRQQGLLSRIKSLIIKELKDEKAIEKIAQILEGKKDSLYAQLHALIDGDIDADKIDYLLRDALYCNARIAFSLKDLLENLYVEKDGKAFYIHPSGINAMNAFLYGRYQLIHDIQHNKNRRIAVQMFIELLASWLFQLSGSERAEQIKKMHIDPEYQDSKLMEELKFSGKEDIRRALFTGNLHYEEKNVFFYWNLDPVSKVCLHSIVSYPPAIIQLQRSLREQLKIPDLLLDIRISKPPDFKVYVLDQQTRFPPVYTWSKTAHGILCESIRDLTVYIYTKKETSWKELKIETFSEMCYKIGVQASTQFLKNTNSLLGTDLIVLGVSAVYSWFSSCSSELGFKEFWIYSQYYFQNFLIKMAKRLNMKIKYEVSKTFNPIFFKDFEILRLAGLLKQREKIIGIPPHSSFYTTKTLTTGELADLLKQKEKIIGIFPYKNYYYYYTPRYDFSITKYGEEYRDLILTSKEIKEIWKKIYNYTTELQNKYKNKIKEFAETEKYTESKERIKEEVSSIRQQIREELFNDGVCIIVP